MSAAPRLPYTDRQEGGRVLAQALQHLRGRAGLLVLALPRGGVPVGYEVARELGAPLDVLIVRKLGHPNHEEYAMGAIASGGIRVMNPEAERYVKPAEVERIARREQAELERRELHYRGDAGPLVLSGRVVILVDDGLATGSTMRAAARAVRQQEPAWTCIAVPVGAPETCESLRAEADEVVCPAQPIPFRAVGLWYRAFPQTGDEEVRRLLADARQALPAAAMPHGS
ncbi:phosphoribosyltransferase [Ramlibacter sp. XY19]|uniref:phosphoribosyltransferase n=1 Tax=Ramlibacter paludis TaxID=2908000 RepID=UPI0023DC9DE4|nr:phosphoribosyltransferase [Ramlibacter paludis]MCG2593606.1 phosphoribosyltransferase [Ramlibacter paludis]